MKKFFDKNKEEIFEIIWKNDNLRTSLFGKIEIKNIKKEYNIKFRDFEKWIQNTNSDIYKFIKAD